MKGERRVAERLLAEAYDPCGAARLLVTTLGWGDLAATIAEAEPQAKIDCAVWDAYAAARATERLTPLSNVNVCCDVDLPAGPYDRIVMPTRFDGDGELTRELILQAFERLVPGGQLRMATDNPNDRWLRDELRRWSPHVSIAPSADGVRYRMTRPDPLPRSRDFSAETIFRDGERLIELRTRPGVFSHRRIDPGARCLIEAMEVEPGARVLDLGCGSGAVGVAAALRAEGVRLTAIDSSPRAVQATRWACDRAGLREARVLLEAEGAVPDPGTFDLVLANPPYYSGHRIPEVMVKAALAALRPGGKLLIVTKEPEWYLERLTPHAERLEAIELRKYRVVCATVD
ncbi:MAG TPA: methyltransferase [Pirellulaceae bacterium]|nr:methyltransferase [Pirellulaceae bacterium]